MSDDANKPKPSERPSWWDEDKQGEWTNDHAMAYSGFREVLGRDIAPTGAEVQGINNWANYYRDHGYGGLTAQLSLSDEARRRGVDPTAYGNTIVDPETLSEKDREWYNAWSEANDGPLYSGILEQLSWRQGLYSVDVYRGMNDGTITVDRNGVITVTPQAIETYGGENLIFHHGGSGQLVRVPEDSGVVIEHRRVYEGEKPEGFTDEQWDEWMSGQNSDGYTLYNTSPSQKKGIGDHIAGGLEDIGLGSDAVDFVMAAVPVVATIVGGPLAGALTAPMAAPFVDDALGIDEAYFATDPLGVTSGIHWGTEGMQRNLEGAESVLGDDAATIQGVGQAVAGTALSFVPVVGWALAAGLGALSQSNKAAAGTQSWGDAFINAGISTVASRIGAGLTAGVEPGIATAFTNAAVQGTSTALQTGLTGRDPVTGERLGWDDALERGGVAALSSFATAGFQNAMGTQDNWAGALQGAAVGGGTSYLSGLALGLEDDALEQSVYSGAATGALSGYAAAGRRRDFYNAEDPKTGQTGYESALERGMAFGPAQQRDLPIPQDASAWDRTVRWGTNFNVGFKPTPEMSAIGRGIGNFGSRAVNWATPWATHREALAAGRQAVYQVPPNQQKVSPDQQIGWNDMMPAPTRPAKPAADTSNPFNSTAAQAALALIAPGPYLFSRAAPVVSRAVGNTFSKPVDWAMDEARPWIPAQKPVAPAADQWAPYVDFYRGQGFATAHGY